MNLRRLKGALVVSVVAGIPVCLWLLGGADADVIITDSVLRFEALAVVTGLVGISLLAINIILSARIHIFSRLFLGLDRTYRAHRVIGSLVIIFLMLHAMFITAKFSTLSLEQGFDFLTSTDAALVIGKLALIVLIALVAISLYLNIRYEWFIRIQRILGAMLFLGGLHALFAPGTELQRNIPLLIYMTLLCGFAAGLYIYRSVFHKSITQTYTYTVKQVQTKANITAITMTPQDKIMPFYAGQFAFFTFNNPHIASESHPFSISSSSDSDTIRICVKHSGDYTNTINVLQPGDSVRIEGPYGQFSFTKAEHRTQVWLAGGIGITPFLSMIHSLDSATKVILYYSVRTAADAVFLPELRAAAKRHKNFTFHYRFTDDAPRFNARDIRMNKTCDYLLCGPVSMMKQLEKQLQAGGVSKNNIYYEEFSLR